MLDSSKSPLAPSVDADWQNSLKYGDILMFRFPGQPAAEQPRARPCLVLDVEMIGLRRCGVLVPALPARRPETTERAVTLTRPLDYRRAGLQGATHFLIRSRLIVPLEHDGFVLTPASGTPVIGRLGVDALERLNVERARLHALRDIRQDRAQNQRPHWRERQRARDFTVQRRNHRRPIAASLTSGPRHNR